MLATVLLIFPPAVAVNGSLGLVYDALYALQGTSALALLGTIVVGSQILKLLRMNKDSYRFENAEVDE
jgi:hypothetical protein